MKKNSIFFGSIFAAIAFVSSVVIVSCQNDDGTAAKEKAFYDESSGTSLSLENTAELNRVAIILAKEKQPVIIVKDAAVVDLTDSQGDFKVISVVYQVGEAIVKMMVPISEVSSDQVVLTSGRGVKTRTYYVVDPGGCEMKCTSVAPCSVCTQEIIERCKSQTCKCSAGDTGCTASISFPAE